MPKRVKSGRYSDSTVGTIAVENFCIRGMSNILPFQFRIKDLKYPNSSQNETSKLDLAMLNSNYQNSLQSWLEAALVSAAPHRGCPYVQSGNAPPQAALLSQMRHHSLWSLLNCWCKLGAAAWPHFNTGDEAWWCSLHQKEIGTVVTKLSMLWNILGTLSNTNAKTTQLVCLFFFKLHQNRYLRVKIFHQKRRQKLLDNKKLFLLGVTDGEFVAPDLTKILGCSI